MLRKERQYTLATNYKGVKTVVTHKDGVVVIIKVEILKIKTNKLSKEKRTNYIDQHTV